MRLNVWCVVLGVVGEWDHFPVDPAVVIIGEESSETDFEKDSWVSAFVLITVEEPTALAVELATSSTQPLPTAHRPTPRRIRPGPR